MLDVIHLTNDVHTVGLRVVKPVVLRMLCEVNLRDKSLYHRSSLRALCIDEIGAIEAYWIGVQSRPEIDSISDLPRQLWVKSLFSLGKALLS